jgi:transposase-like protein
VLLCLDLEEAAAQLAAGLLPCPSCRPGKLAPWGSGREREIRLWGGRTQRLVPPRGRCSSCRRTHTLIPAWTAPRRRYGCEVTGTAALLAAAGRGHRAIARELGVPDGTVRDWLRRLRSGAETARQRITWRLAHGPGLLPPGGAWTRPARSVLGEVMNMLIAATGEARRRFWYLPDMTWPLIGQLGLARWLMPGAG